MLKYAVCLSTTDHFSTDKTGPGRTRCSYRLPLPAPDNRERQIPEQNRNKEHDERHHERGKESHGQDVEAHPAEHLHQLAPWWGRGPCIRVRPRLETPLSDQCDAGAVVLLHKDHIDQPDQSHKDQAKTVDRAKNPPVVADYGPKAPGLQGYQERCRLQTT